MKQLLAEPVRELNIVVSQLVEVISVLRQSYTVLRGIHVTMHETNRDVKILLNLQQPKKPRRKLSHKRKKR